MTALALQHIVDAGTEPTAGTPTTSDTAPIGNGSNFVCYKNTDTNVKTLTIPTHNVLDDGDASPNHVITLAATTGVVKFPLRKSYDDGTGFATINLTGTGGVTGVTSYVATVG